MIEIEHDQKLIAGPTVSGSHGKSLPGWEISCKVEVPYADSNGSFAEIPLVIDSKPGQVIVGMSQRGYCIYINTLSEGPVPLVRDGSGKPVVFATEREAQLEIADAMMTRLQEFIDGDRDFDDAVTLEEYVVAVDVMPDGTIVDEDGNEFV